MKKMTIFSFCVGISYLKINHTGSMAVPLNEDKEF